MLQLEKIKNNIQNLLLIKNKIQYIKLASTRDIGSNILSNNAIETMPLLTDMEFKWAENNYY